MTEGNAKFLSKNDDIKIEGVDDFYFAIVFAGPESTAMKMTRRGVSSEVLGAVATKLLTMAEVELGNQHQALLMQMAERAKMSQISVPDGVVRRKR